MKNDVIISKMLGYYGLRNRIVHDYEGVNLKLVWEIIEYDLPELEDKLSELK